MKIDFLKVKKQQEEKPIDPITADIINVKAIEDHFLYTRDDYVHVYLRVEPISIDLLSNNEKRQLAGKLTAEMKGDRDEFKLIVVPRPVDLSALVSKYSELLAESTNPVEKILLRDEISTMNRYILSGEVVEKQFYFMLWEPYSVDIERELLRRATEFAGKFSDNSIRCKIMTESEIVLLCNLINNPAYINLEDLDYAKTVPLVTEERFS